MHVIIHGIIWKETIGTLRHRGKDNVKLYCEELRFEVVDRIRLIQDGI
jgi:hypothetical protein